MAQLPENLRGQFRTFETVQEYSHSQQDAPWRPVCEVPPREAAYLVIRTGVPFDICRYRNGKWWHEFPNNDHDATVLYWMPIPPDPPELIEFEYGSWRHENTNPKTLT